MNGNWFPVYEDDSYNDDDDDNDDDGAGALSCISVTLLIQSHQARIEADGDQMAAETPFSWPNKAASDVCGYVCGCVSGCKRMCQVWGAKKGKL